jgi:UDP-N-acetylmuramate--alanine ligase
LHGPYGEDGRIQGLLEYFQIPYSGSGILPSAIGIDKSVQKQLMVDKGFNSPNFMTVSRHNYINGMCKNILKDIEQKIDFPCVIKPANQGSSIGVSILEKADETAVMSAIEKALFTHWMDAKDWQQKSNEEKTGFIKKLSDIREGIGMPMLVSVFPDNASLTDETTIYNPDELLNYFNEKLKSGGMMLQSMDGESTVLIEGFIEGKEFSCIVAEDENGTPIALPPTEIRKGKELFDYRSKYLPGLSRKITPIDLPDDQIEAIRKECERLFLELKFDVYARIDGFLGKDGKIFLNDPNTTSGMMPSSFFFHQAAEIGLNPSQFLTFIISTSCVNVLYKRKETRYTKNYN